MKRFSRRALLASAGTLSAGGLAGCLGGGSGGSGGNGSGDERECSGEQRSVEVPPLGDPESDVVVTAYEDFACPGCKQYAENTAPEIKAEYAEPGDIAYEHRDFPFHGEWSWPVANASLAVFEDAGAEAYYPFIEEVYQYQGEYSADNVAGLAAELGASEQPVREAIESGPFCEQLKESKSEGQQRGIEATPTVFVNDQQLQAPSVEELREAIESALS
ncbi:DsbA family protein [Halalkalicoccus jeotgali]|uniref:Disulfide bond formation protein n=1 Tax=Halalkalicoccus jeotgali (strain DSM 18796 / CECT 7217 / JCM 14584 / KCTC 4019 / B3) TaxID=795797 RepID=D8J867_HALJB|nr:thioredoxin domain-containing protein [Halalkalicoccus jeotgali]ADJ14180.1 disulfide bond formation protein [Halalkalicoccus jeotgali B3]ELY34638.1 disulfide bond formation protein [Halalkalicoccus jeotgali B3]